MTTPAAPAPRRAAVVYNPVKIDKDTLHAAVALAESEHGWAKTLWLETTEDDPGEGLAACAVEQRPDVVLVAGGDGTVRAVAAGLRGSGIPLTLLPSGTGNLLARNLGLDVNARLEAAVDTAFSGADRAIDVGVIDIDRADGSTETHAFVVMAGLGLDAKMIANTDPELKRKVGWLAYVGAIGKTLVDKEVLRIRYRLDGGELRTSRVHTILIGNCGALPGNIQLLPDAEVDDGLFDIVTLRPEGVFGWARVWVGIVWENGVLRQSTFGRKLLDLRSKPVRVLRYLRGRELELSLDRPEEFELDGDEFGQITGFRTRVDPASLIVRVPREEP